MKMLNLRIIVLATGLLVGASAFSQNTEIPEDSIQLKEKRLNFGLGFNLSFVGGTNIGLSPNLTYAVSDKISFGAGLQGNYISIRDVQNTLTFGGNAAFQYNPSRTISTLIEFAQLNVTRRTLFTEEETRDNFWESALFLGIGINVTNKIAIGAKYNVLYDSDESVYTSPVVPFVNVSF